MQLRASEGSPPLILSNFSWKQSRVLARASVPCRRLTEADGGVRGIDRMCAQRVGCQDLCTAVHEVRVECAPIQWHRLCGAFLQAATDADPQATILSVDGIRAYDQVLRSTIFERLMNMPTAQAMLPFVRLSYGTPFLMFLSGRWWQTEVRHTSRGWRNRGTHSCLCCFLSGTWGN